MSNQLWLSHARFEELVDEAIHEIPEALWEQIDNVAIVIEDWPTRRQMEAARLAPGHLLLGLYHGVPITGRGRHDNLMAPDKISIFRGSILSICPPDEDAVREQVRRTVLHEIAHYFGISDERLHELNAY